MNTKKKKKTKKKKQKEANVFLFCIEVETLNKISIKDFKLQQIKLKCIWWKIVNALHLIKSCHEIPQNYVKVEKNKEVISSREGIEYQLIWFQHIFYYEASHNQASQSKI